MRTRGLLTAVLLAAVVATVVGSSAISATPPVEMSYLCAKKDGNVRYVTSLAQCHKDEIGVTIKPGPVYICAAKDGHVKRVAAPACPPDKTLVVLPPTSGTVYFCVKVKDGHLRYVTDPSKCHNDEFPVFVSPNDQAPFVTTTSPTNGATQVAVNTNIVVNFSESVTVSTSSFSLECPSGTPKTFTVSGSPGSASTLDPTADLPQEIGKAACR